MHRSPSELVLSGGAAASSCLARQPRLRPALPSQHPPEAITSSARRALGLLGDRASSILRPRLLLRPAPAGPAPSGPVAPVCTDRTPLLDCCAAARPRRRLSSETATGRRTCDEWSMIRGTGQIRAAQAPAAGWRRGGCRGEAEVGGCSAAWMQGGGRSGRPAARRQATQAPLRRVPPAWCTAGWAVALAAPAGGRAA